MDLDRTSVRHQNILIVQAAPLIRLGLESLVAETEKLSSYKVISVATLVEASEKLSYMEKDDIIILDSTDWNLLNSSKYAALYGRMKSHGISVGVIGAVHRVHRNGELTYDVAGLVAAEAELQHITAMIEDLAVCKKHVSESMPVNRFAEDFLLTKREAEILELMAEGLSNKEIALRLQVYEGTVKSHVSKIFKKLNCHQRAHAIVAFIQNSR
jgi:DNA-binding NarL/FixJ family response regulator